MGQTGQRCNCGTLHGGQRDAPRRQRDHWDNWFHFARVHRELQKVNWIESKKDADDAIAKVWSIGNGAGAFGSANFGNLAQALQPDAISAASTGRFEAPLVAAVVPEVNQGPVPSRSATRISGSLGQVNTKGSKRAKASEAGKHVGVTVHLLETRLAAESACP